MLPNRRSLGERTRCHALSGAVEHYSVIFLIRLLFLMTLITPRFRPCPSLSDWICTYYGALVVITYRYN